MIVLTNDMPSVRSQNRHCNVRNCWRHRSSGILKGLALARRRSCRALIARPRQIRRSIEMPSFWAMSSFNCSPVLGRLSQSGACSSSFGVARWIRGRNSALEWCFTHGSEAENTSKTIYTKTMLGPAKARIISGRTSTICELPSMRWILRSLGHVFDPNQVIFTSIH